MAKHGSEKKRRRKQINRELQRNRNRYVRVFGGLPDLHGPRGVCLSPEIIEACRKRAEEKAEAAILNA